MQFIDGENSSKSENISVILIYCPKVQLRALEHTFRRDQTDQLDQLSLIVKSRYANFPFALSIDCEINLKGITKS